MISDNKHHITYSADDIQRYWNGQLTSQEMHAMEKAALDDPFLADAMEGMGEALRVHDEQLVNAELNTLHQQLAARVDTKRRQAPVRGFKWWHAAAAAIILVVGGLWIFTSDNELAKDELAKTTAPQEQKAVAPAVADSIAPQQQAKAATDSVMFSNSYAQSTEPNAGNKQKQPEPGFYKFKTPEADGVKDTFQFNTRQQWAAEKKGEEKLATLLERAAPAKSAPPIVTKSDSDKQVPTEVVTIADDLLVRRNERAVNYDKEVKLQNIVKGVVTDNKNRPLANAFIRLDDKNAYTTDTKGNFNFPVTDSVVQVSVSMLGYNTQNFRLRTDNTDNAARANQAPALNQIQLQPNNAALDEVVVVGYGSQKKSALTKDKGEYYRTAEVQNADPTYGWLAFEEYLEKNKRVPADNPNLVGEVILTFAVNKRGELSEFRVEKSLSPQHDAEAQRLVRQGPSWKLKRGRKSRVTVIVRF